MKIPIDKVVDIGSDAIKSIAIGTAGVAAIGVQAIGGTAAGAAKLFSNAFIGTDPKKYANMPFKMGLNKAGIATMLAVGAAAGIKNGYNSYTSSRMGTPMGIENSTPVVPQYENPENPRRNMQQFRAEDYGAGGDLVFALNRNRH